MSGFVFSGDPASQPASGTVVGALREAIVAGVIRPGEPLRQEDLAAALSVSRMPVREALRQLQAEGMVIWVPHRGATVAELSAHDVRQIDDIRAALEPLALRKSLPALAESQLLRATEILDRMRETQDIPAWTRLNEEFHLSLYSAAGAPRLISVITAQYTALARYVNLHLRVKDYRRAAQREHRQLLATCRARNSEKAAALLTEHIVASSVEIANFIESQRSETNGERSLALARRQSTADHESLRPRKRSR